MKAITVKYFGPGNVRGSRYVATAEGGHRLSLQADDALDSDGNKDAAAIALCRKLGWTKYLLVRGGLANGDNVYTFLADDNRVPITFEQACEIGDAERMFTAEIEAEHAENS